MALTEQTVVNQVVFSPTSNTVSVQWANQILRDGELVSETYHRKAYGADQIDEFLVEVDGAEQYRAAFGW